VPGQLRDVINTAEQASIIYKRTGADVEDTLGLREHTEVGRSGRPPMSAPSLG